MPQSSIFPCRLIPLLDPDQDADEIAQHVESIRAIPDEQFPDIDARLALLALAEEGYDVYAYRPAYLPEHVIWIRQPEPCMEGRWNPQEWAAAWRASLHTAEDADSTVTVPRFAVGTVVSWPQGRCTFRVDGFSTLPEPPYTVFYGGPMLSYSGVDPEIRRNVACGYVLSVPDDQVEPIADTSKEDTDGNQATDHA